MDGIDVTERFKVVLDLINKIPEFNGNTNCLVEFLDRVDSIAPILTTFDEMTVRLLSGYIRDKIVGKARIELQKHGRIGDWAQLKEILKISFGERLSANELLDQIRTTRVKTNIGDYYNSLNFLLSRINNLYLLNNNQNDQSVISSNNRIALNAFKNNLPEPTKSIILSRNPNSLIEAYKIIHEINHHNFGPNTSGPTQYFRQQNRNSNYNSYQANEVLPYRNNNQNNSYSRNNNNSSNLYARNNGNRQNNSSSISYTRNNENRQSRQNNNNNYSSQPNQSNTSQLTRNTHNNNIYNSRTYNHENNTNNSRNSGFSRNSRNSNMMEIEHISNEVNFHIPTSDLYPV